MKLLSSDSHWQSLHLTSGDLTGASGISWEPYERGYDYSDRGDFVTESLVRNASRVGIWPTGVVAEETPPLYADVRLASPRALTVSRDGKALLVEDSTGLFLAGVRSRGAATEGTDFPLELTGLGAVSGLAFLDIAERFVVASGESISFWDTRSLGRLTQRTPLAARAECTAFPYSFDCRSSLISVSPDGSRLAIVDLAAVQVEVVVLPGQVGEAVTRFDLPMEERPASLGRPLWLDASTVLILDSRGEGSIDGLPEGVFGWGLGLGGDEELLGAVVDQDGQTIKLVTSQGRLQRRDARTGRLLGEGSIGVERVSYSGFSQAVFSPDGEYLVVVDDGEYSLDDDAMVGGSVSLVAASTGRVVRAVRDLKASVDGVQYAGSTAIVQFDERRVEFWGDHGRSEPRSLSVDLLVSGGFGSMQRTSMIASSDLVIGMPTATGVSLFDLVAGATLAEIPNPAGWESVPREYAFTPDGRGLVTAFFGTSAADAVVTVLSLDPERLVQSACATSGSAITPEMWRQLVGTEPPSELVCR